MMMNETGHMNCNSDIDGDLSECKDIDTCHDDDWDDDFKKDLGLECESGSHTTSTPMPKSNLDEVIDLVIQDAIDYANSPEDKRILPLLTRKPNKGKNKCATTTNSISNHTYKNAHNSQQGTMTNNNEIMMSANNNQSSFHPLMQQNLSHGMQHMLQLASTSKSGIHCPGVNTTSSTMQHNNTTSQPQQGTNTMMGFSASQIPNMIMPSYNTSLSNYTQQTPNSQYSLPVTLSQLQMAHQQQSQLLLGNNQSSFTDLSTTSNNQQQGLNFCAGISSSNPQLMQSSYVNFGSNSSISPYQIPGMIQAYATQSVSDNSNSNNISQNDSQNSITNLSTNPASASCFSSSKPNNSALTNTTNNNNNSASSNQNNSNSSSSIATSLYQGNTFDLQQTQQLYAQQRLLQHQQQQQQQLQQSNAGGLFPDYAAVMARYGAYQ